MQLLSHFRAEWNCIGWYCCPKLNNRLSFSSIWIPLTSIHWYEWYSGLCNFYQVQLRIMPRRITLYTIRLTGTYVTDVQEICNSWSFWNRFRIRFKQNSKILSTKFPHKTNQNERCFLTYTIKMKKGMFGLSMRWLCVRWQQPIGCNTLISLDAGYLTVVNRYLCYVMRSLGDYCYRVNMVVVDGLAPIRHQGICNHHVDLWWSARLVHWRGASKQLFEPWVRNRQQQPLRPLILREAFYLYCLLRRLLNRPESVGSIKDLAQVSPTTKHLAAIEICL